MDIQVCELATPLVGTTTHVTISPSGVVAVPGDLDNKVYVFQRNEQSTPCTYEPDPDFGTGGVVTLSGYVRKLDFDGSGRLYVGTDTTNSYVTGIKSRFVSLIGGTLPSPDPFTATLVPEVTKYCK